LMTP